MWLFDANGNDYLDFTSGIAVNSLGHAHPYLVSALQKQAEKLWHTSNLFAVPERQLLAARLCQHCFADQVFFTNSGAEALECAIKTTRKYHHSKGNSQRVNILTFAGAFHGRTLATIAAGGQQKHLEGFAPIVDGFVQLPFANQDIVSASIDKYTAGILIEPIMGEGGILQHSHQYLQHLRQLCDDNDLVLIYDEVQTGIARTGKLFAYQWSGVEPDIMALAKGLGGGFPIGACLAREKISKSMTVGSHGTTFGGNPLAMAVANAVLDIVLADDFLDKVELSSSYLRQCLTEYLANYPQLFEQIRGQGLMLGLQCKVPNNLVISALRQAAILVAPAADNVIRLFPPLIINQHELQEANKRMNKAFTLLANQQES